MAPETTGGTWAPDEVPGGGDWVVPDADILEAFEEAAEALEGLAVYRPSQLPAGARLVESLPEDGRARAVVAVGVAGGRLEFLQVIQGDLGDLPAERVEFADGRRASVYAVVGGFLVQWADGAAWYGVYATGLPREEVLRVAEHCVVVAEME